MEETINQHFVPRTYLKHFSSEKNEFVDFARTPFVSTDSIKATNIKKICFEKYIYTLPGATIEERMLIERIYSDVFEKDYDMMFNILIDPQRVQLTDKERTFIITTVAMLYYRTTSWNSFTYEIFDDLIDRAYKLAKAHSKDRFILGNEEIIIGTKTLDDMKKEHREKARVALALGQLRHIVALSNLRDQSDQIMISKLEGNEDEFIHKRQSGDLPKYRRWPYHTCKS